MSRVYVGNLDPRATERELEDEFRVYGVLRRFVVSPFLSYFLSPGFIETLGSSSLCASGGFWRYRDMRFSGERGVALCCRGSCNGCNL